MRARAGVCSLVCACALPAAAGGSPQVVRIAAVGDIALAPAPDASALLARARADLAGDLVLGNLEGTLASGGTSKCTKKSTACFAFRAPPGYARALRSAGFTLLNLANNHALDFGREGQTETVAALERAGLRHTGRPREIAYVLASGVRVAMLGFAPYRWAQSLTDIVAAQHLVRHAVEAADIVVVTIHAGAEGAAHAHVRPGTETYLGENRGDAVAFAHAVVDAGADLVVGSGPHVLRGLEWYEGRLIAYSLGNFVGNGTLDISGANGVGGVLQVSLRADGTWASGRLRSVLLVAPGLPVVDIENQAAALVRSLSEADFGPRAMRVSRAGVLTPPS